MAVSALPTLLEVQALDTSAEQLVHRRESLPARAELAAVTAEEARLQLAHGEVSDEAHELERSQRRLEDEVASLEEKASTTDRQLYGGTVTAPRELQALQDEASALRRRISVLEDELLGIMEQLEPVSAEVARLGAAQEDAAARAVQLRADITAAVKAIDEELAEVRSCRQALAASVPQDLLARYERIRERSGGVGIARLDDHRCTGCHLVLPNREVDELRRLPADAIVLHDECGRLLVRD